VIRWAILSGEYPPQPGGVADYTGLVAAGLVAAGDRVTVYAPAHAAHAAPDNGVAVRRLPDHFGPRGLLTLDAALAARPQPHRILVQYTPQAFGCKGMNFPFTAWAAGPARRLGAVWVMFHEVMFPVEQGQSLRHAVLGRVTRAMARLLGRSADRTFVSIPAWARLLHRLCRPARPAEWLPVPSNVPLLADPARTASVRAGVSRGQATVVVGHFGTFGGMNSELVTSALAAVLRRSGDRVGLLVGRNGDRFCEQFLRRCPEMAGRVTATGALPPDDVAAHLAACDLLLQPYPDGISSRRGSAMAGIALGVPTATNAGALSEAVWGSESDGVAVARSADAGELAATVEAMLALPPAARAARGQAAAAWYRSRFDLAQTIRRLRG
jgi:glycosyltransferase involved in cell wall biosynthesis